ncbi:MAG: phospholipase D-like domain-containing protein [Geminocystis sp.]|nr:phospholipase D-like domain-containing protein [Geminocystis sp.]HIK38910.1 competence protein ComE [Geminocystis sp. M7585_C2015_104]MCS7148366.1 phospholipase D-like domain-containing protein [Geminocystis sp.]MCX8078320.1 phospholipase D-like domain-containing protein [Geminocystis sp.]MDW8116046.1 phospholipase D-like domain-containing protein [Geminocystis sp.]
MFKNSIYLAIAFTFFSLGGCSQPPVKPLPPPQDKYIQVYFNHNQARGKEYTEKYRNLKRFGDDLESVLIREVNSAKYSIDIAVQEFNLPQLAEAIVKKRKQGVKVRIVLENLYNFPLEGLPENHGLAILKRNNIPIIDDREDGSKGSGLMHHKFVVIDGKKVITGSANFTTSDIHGDGENPETRGNANHLILIDSPELAKVFTEEFNYMWGDGVGGKEDSLFGVKKPARGYRMVKIGTGIVLAKFSPNSRNTFWRYTSNGFIASQLEKAGNSIDIALFVFSDQGIADTLERQHIKGVKIRTLIDPGFAYRYYSEGLDLLGVALPNKCQYEKGNNPWENPVTTVGIPSLAKGDKLHHKFAIIDDYIVITGSHNWSDAANYINDETVLVIYNSVVAANFAREFEYLYSQAILGVTPSLEAKIRREKSKCGM